MDQRPGVVDICQRLASSANYMMVHEHYLDFSYAPILHRRDVPPEIESMPAFNDVEVTETTVSYTRLLPDGTLTDWQADATGLDRALVYKHRESGTFVSPAMHRQYWEIERADGERVHHHSNPRHHTRDGIINSRIHAGVAQLPDR